MLIKGEVLIQACRGKMTQEITGRREKAAIYKPRREVWTSCVSHSPQM